MSGSFKKLKLDERNAAFKWVYSIFILDPMRGWEQGGSGPGWSTQAGISTDNR
jgi:hypothetical protein